MEILNQLKSATTDKEKTSILENFIEVYSNLEQSHLDIISEYIRSQSDLVEILEGMKDDNAPKLSDITSMIDEYEKSKSEIN